MDYVIMKNKLKISSFFQRYEKQEAGGSMDFVHQVQFVMCDDKKENVYLEKQIKATEKGFSSDISYRI